MNVVLHSIIPLSRITFFCNQDHATTRLYLMQDPFCITAGYCSAMLQDVVTRGGKFVFLYKRPGHRVIVKNAGQMMVSPSALEASVQQYLGGK